MLKLTALFRTFAEERLHRSPPFSVTRLPTFHVLHGAEELLLL
jgi:hypothetical protein